MTNRKLRKILEERINQECNSDELYEMRKSKLTFTHLSEPTITLSKKKFTLGVTFASILLVSLIGVSSYLLVSQKNDYENIVINNGGKVDEALAQIRTECDSILDTPLVSKNIDNNFFINIYYGGKNSTTFINNYYFQILNLKYTDVNVSFTFYTANASESYDYSIIDSLNKFSLNNGNKLDELNLKVTYQNNNASTDVKLF